MKQLLILTLISLSFSQYDIGNPPDHGIKKAKVMTLGVFHFSYPGKDTHKTKDELKIDVKTPQRQKEVMDVVNRILKFKPTKILIEWKPKDQRFVDSTYNLYLQDKFELKHNEVYQFGYRMAKMMNLKKVYCTDDRGRFFDQDWDDYEKRLKAYMEENKEQVAKTKWYDRFMSYYDSNDRYRYNHTILESLTKMNHPEMIRRSHMVYFTDRFDFETEDFDFSGVDGFISGWYNRNMRVYRNIKRFTEDENDRILVIYGAGHLPIINHLLEHSPIHEFVSPMPYLRGEK